MVRVRGRASVARTDLVVGVSVAVERDQFAAASAGDAGRISRHLVTVTCVQVVVGRQQPILLGATPRWVLRDWPETAELGLAARGR